MTTSATTYSKNGFRYYHHKATQEMMPSVTSILSLIPSPELQRWKEQKIVNSCLNDLEQLKELDRDLATRYLSEAPERASRAAINKGIAIHKKIENRNNRVEIRKEDRDFIRTYEALLDKYDIQILKSEVRGFNTVKKYAGTIDAIATVSGKTILLDFKTGKNLYPNAAVQLMAYSLFNEFEGIEAPLKIEDAYIVHIRNGVFELLKVQHKEFLIKYFNSLLELFNNYQGSKRKKFYLKIG